MNHEQNLKRIKKMFKNTFGFEILVHNPKVSLSIIKTAIVLFIINS